MMEEEISLRSEFPVEHQFTILDGKYAFYVKVQEDGIGMIATTLLGNDFFSGIKDLILAHAQSNINVSHPDYIDGIELAIENSCVDLSVEDYEEEEYDKLSS